MSYRIRYLDLVKSAGLIQMGKAFLSKEKGILASAGVSSVVIGFLVQALYVIPLFLLLIWSVFWISVAVQETLYAVGIPRTPENRWKINGFLNAFWNAPLAFLGAWALEFLVVIVGLIPWKVGYEINHRSDWYAGVNYNTGNDDNLFFVVWNNVLELAGNEQWASALFNALVWDHTHPVLSIVRLLVAVFLLFCYYHSPHRELSKEEFVQLSEHQYIDLRFEMRTFNREHSEY